MDAEPDAAKARIRAIFDRISPDYDDEGPGCFAYFGRRLVHEVGIEPGQRVLDVATGRGAVLIPAAERTGPRGRAIGGDLAGGMVALTAAEVNRRGLAAEVLAMDAEHVAFPDACFDRVLCGFGVMFFPHLPRALAEFLRVLKPGGVLGISTWHTSQVDDLRAVLVQQGLMDAEGDPAMRFRDASTVVPLLTAAGFRDARAHQHAHTFRYTDNAQYWRNARSTGLRRWLDGLDPDARDGVVATLDERLRPFTRADGLHLEATALFAIARR